MRKPVSFTCKALNIFCDKRKILKRNLKTCPILGLLLLLSVFPLLSNFREPNFKVKSEKQYLKKNINLENVYQNQSKFMKSTNKIKRYHVGNKKRGPILTLGDPPFYS